MRDLCGGLPLPQKRSPSEETVDAIRAEVRQALRRPTESVGPTEGFRQQLAERLSMAANSRMVGVSIEDRRQSGRALALGLAAVIALTLTGLALVMRRLAR